jgi:tRNA pseudouridine(38-40) synthase
VTLTTQQVRIKVIGQSFVTHQIRKMVALILLAAHRVVPKEIVSIVIRGPLSFKIPLAPPEGTPQALLFHV